MKKLLCGLFLMTELAYGTPTSLTIKDFNFNYTNPSGEGAAAAFTRNQFMDQKVFVKVDRVDHDFILNVSGAETQELVLANAPSFMTEAETMAVAKFNLAWGEELKMKLAQATFNSRSDSLNLSGVSVDCAREQKLPEVMDQVLAGCAQKMIFKSSQFSSQNEAEAILSTFIERAPRGSIGINGVDFKVNNGSYTLSANVKADVSGKVRSSGTINYQAASGLMTIKISEVKFSILNVTGKVFDELKKMESDKIKVQRPYVYVKMK